MTGFSFFGANLHALALLPQIGGIQLMVGRAAK
jgi:hypothetical protein